MREKPKWTDIAIVILTVGIVLAAILQTIVFYGSGSQTDKLIDAAKRQAGAAEQFRDSAASINTAIECRS